jgi:transposase
MEATGGLLEPVYYLLEDDLELLLVNAQHVENVPGRKTDVADAHWLCRCSSTVCSGPAMCRRSRSASSAASGRLPHQLAPQLAPDGAVLVLIVDENNVEFAWLVLQPAQLLFVDAANASGFGAALQGPEQR